MAINYNNKSLNDFAVQESVAPFVKAVAADTTNGNDACRAIHFNGTSGPVSLTVDGVVVSFQLLKGIHIIYVLLNQVLLTYYIFILER